MAQFGSINLQTLAHAKAHRLIFSSLAILAFVCCALTRWHDAGYVLGALTLIGIAWTFQVHNQDRLDGAQVLVLAAFSVAYAEHVGAGSAILIAVSLVISGLLLNQDLFAGLQSAEVANLRGRGLGTRPLLDSRAAATTHTAAVVLVGAGAAFRLPIWIIGAVTLVIAGASVAQLGQHVWQRRTRSHRNAQLHAAVEALRPEFAVYFNAPPDSEYQLTMWLPYLERIGVPFIVLLREPEPLPIIATATSAPVIMCTTVKDVANLIVPSLRAVFYVNNGMKNVHMVRFSNLTHIQLLHGDSDKAPSYNPVTTMFDRVYVAGQAAIDRYSANGVSIPLEKFEIVGRPQVESIEVRPAGSPRSEEPTVMYGTTWSGLYSDSNYSSLEIGASIVEELLRRHATVIFRSHPYAVRQAETRVLVDRIDGMLAADRAASGRPHLFGKQAQTMSLFDCFNRADALISDVSGIASDFLYSEKPLAMTDMAGDDIDFSTKFPVSAAAYVLRADAANLGPVLDELLVLDSLAETRRRIKRHYLGDFPPDSYAAAFVESARRELLLSSPDRAEAVA